MHEDRPPFYRETANHNRPWPPKYLEKMKPTNENEISRLIAFQMSMGLVPLSSFTDYWSTDPAYSSGRYFSQLAGLSRDRYQSLLSILCLYHPNDIADPRWKGCHLWYKCGAELERLNEVRKTHFTLGKFNSSDEIGVKAFHNMGLIQDCRFKPIKRGMIFQAMATWDGLSWHYAFPSSTYQNLGKQGKTRKILLYNFEHHAPRGTHWLIDNLYSAFEVSEKCFHLGIGVCGTCRANRGAPPSFAEKSPRAKSLPKGQWISATKSHSAAVLWHDSKPTTFLSNAHSPHVLSTVQRRQKGQAGRTDFEVPVMIDFYNRYKGGVDIEDLLRSNFSCHRPSNKWWMPLYYFKIDSCRSQAYLKYNKRMKQLNRLPMSHKDFLLLLIRRLCGQPLGGDDLQNEVRPSPNRPIQAKRVRTSADYSGKWAPGHVVSDIRAPEGYQVLKEKKGFSGKDRRRCVRCWQQRTKTNSVYTRCNSCNVFLCTEFGCFESYHNKKD